MAVMTGKDKIEAAFSRDGAAEFAATICYESIFVRDHWSELTRSPWWHMHAPHLATQCAWRSEAICRTGQDWFELPDPMPREWRQAVEIHVRADGVYRVDRWTGSEERLEEHKIGGELAQEAQGRLPKTAEEVDQAIGIAPTFDHATFVEEARGELAVAMLAEFGGALFPMRHVLSPLWAVYHLWGFDGMMSMIALRPVLVQRACERNLAWSLHNVATAAALGARGIWIEECMTDMISPTDFASLNVPYVQRLVESIREKGMKSIYYYCGNPRGKLSLLLECGADGLALEEGKKGFVIDIDDIVDQVAGRCTVLGNLDSVGVLQDGDEDVLRAEIKRQLAAGRRNGGRFVMSIGSPVTPGTSVRRVRLYCDLVHELGAR